MGRPKGTPKTGGRKKGSKNKKPNEAKEWIRDLIESNKEEFERRMKLLDNSEYVKTYTQLLNYVIPKQSSVNADDLIKRERAMLQELLFTQPEQTIKLVAGRLYELSNKEVV